MHFKIDCVSLTVEGKFTVFALFTGLPVRPSHKFGFRSSVSKNRHPGEGRHEGLVPRNDVVTNGFYRIFSCMNPCTDTFCTSSPLPLKQPTRRCEPEGGYLRCSKRFDHGSYSIIFLLFEFKSVR